MKILLMGNPNVANAGSLVELYYKGQIAGDIRGDTSLQNPIFTELVEEDMDEDEVVC